MFMGWLAARARCRSRDWFRCTSELHPRQGDSSSHPRCDSPGPVSPLLRLLVALAVGPDTGRGAQSSHPGVICCAWPGGAAGSHRRRAGPITGPAAGHHGPFGRIDLLKGPNGRWCPSRARLLLSGPARPGRSAHDAHGESRGAAGLDEPGELMLVDVTGLGLSQRPGDPQTLELGSPAIRCTRLSSRGMCAIPGVAPHTAPGLVTSSSGGR
jgi:hypothetical protein